MPIEIPQVNMSALAALSGSRSPSLHLASPADAVLQNRQMDIDQQRANQTGEYQMGQLDTQNQGQMLDFMKGQQQMGMQQQQMSQEAALNAQKMGMAQQQFAHSVSQDSIQNEREAKEQEQKARYNDALMNHVNEQAKTEAQNRSRKDLEGMLAVSTAISNMPLDKLESNKASIIGAAVKSGLVDEDAGKKLASMSAPEINSMSKVGFLVSTNALKMKEAELKAKQPAQGTVKITDPNTGQVVYEATTLDKTNQTQAIKSGTDADESLKNLQQIGTQYKKDYLGAGGMLKSNSLKGRDWLSTLPGADSMIGLGDSDKNWLKGYASFRSSGEAMAMSVIKQLSGVQYSDKQLEFMKKIIPGGDNSPSEFEGKFNSMIDRLHNLKDLKSQLLSKGYRLGSEDYKKEYLSQTESTMLGLKDSNANVTGRDGKVYSRDTIEKYAKANKMSTDDVIKRIK